MFLIAFSLLCVAAVSPAVEKKIPQVMRLAQIISVLTQISRLQSKPFKSLFWPLDLTDPSGVGRSQKTSLLAPDKKIIHAATKLKSLIFPQYLALQLK